MKKISAAAAMKIIWATSDWLVEGSNILTSGAENNGKYIRLIIKILCENEKPAIGHRRVFGEPISKVFQLAEVDPRSPPHPRSLERLSRRHKSVSAPRRNRRRSRCTRDTESRGKSC